MSNIKSKLTEFLKNLKSDAVPRPPRAKPRVTKKTNGPTPQNDDADSNNESEEIIIEEIDEEEIKQNNTKAKTPSAKSDKNTLPKKGKDQAPPGSVNTQATGNVINVVGCNNFRWGNDYYLGATNGKPKPPFGIFDDEDSDQEEPIQKCRVIEELLEVQIKPEREYLIHVSNNLGKNWKKFFRKLGFTDGSIETYEIDNKSYGVSEARYQLLLRWVNNKEEATLGKLAMLLWKQDEKRIVKDLAEMYAQNKKGEKKT